MMRTILVLILATFSMLGVAGQRKKKSVVDKEDPPQSLSLDKVEDPKDFETCFSPDEPCDVKLAKFVREAQKSLDIAIYDITLDQLVHEILAKKNKIKVRIVVDQRQSKGAHSLVPLLAKAGADVRYGRQRGIMHNKFIVRDGLMIETGSFNYSNNAYRNNNENQIYIANAAVVDRYAKRFNEIWEKAVPVPVPTQQQQSQKPNGSTEIQDD